MTEEWFSRHGCNGIDPVRQAEVYGQWLAERQRTEEQKFRKLMQLASGKAESSVRHYLRGRWKRVQDSLHDLDRIAAELGRPRVGGGRCTEPEVPDKLTHIAVLTQVEMCEVPSVRYHWDVVSSILRQASRHMFAVALHPVSASRLEERVEEIVRFHDPDAAIAIRLTPSAAALNCLKENGIPTILVHADRVEYKAPVLANIVPDQSRLAEQIKLWAGNVDPGKVVVVSMPREAVLGSLRNERIDAVCKAFDKRQPDMIVPDYSFRHAAEVVAKHPKAKIYVALSDEIALGIKQLLEARGEAGRLRILGFDNSHLAQSEIGNFSSVGQSLEGIGRKAIDTLCHFVYGEDSNWPVFREIRDAMQLQLRD